MKRNQIDSGMFMIGAGFILLLALIVFFFSNQKAGATAPCNVHNPNCVVLPSTTPTPTPTATPSPSATPSSHKVTICHATSSSTNPWVRTVVDEHATAGHFDNNGTPLAGHEGDVLLQGDVDCPTVNPTPSPSVSPTPTPSPYVTPSPTPTPEVVNQTSTGPSAPQCEAVAPTKEMANFHVYRNGDDAILKWFPTEGSQANIYYRQNSSANWQYSLTGTENDGYVEIHGLGNLDITFAGQQANGCAGGPMTNAVIDGPSDHWVLFR